MKRRIKNWLVYRFVTAVVFFFNLLSRKNAIFGGRTLGRWAFFLLKDSRKTTLENLESVFGKLKNKDELRKIALNVFENIGKNVVDVARLGKLDLSAIEKMIRVEGLKHFDSAYKKGKGVIALTGHIGNFELLAAYFSLKGYRVSVIGRDLSNPRLNKLLIRNRKSVGMENISSSEDVRKIIKALSSGRALGVLADQDSTRVKGMFVRFFGRPARTPVGPALLHLKLGSPVVPMVILGNGDEKYKIVVKPELHFEPTGDKNEDVKRLTQKYTEILEQVIRENPSQWVWMHRRWKSRPTLSERELLH
jgi:KDO2-lipid IV(A) lauroyltransferase